MLHLISAHMHLPGKTKALGCWSFALTSLLVAGLYLMTWREYEVPDYGRWVEVQGKVNGHGSSWKPDRSLLQFGVRFTLPGEAQEEVRPVYADRQAFSESGLRIGMPVTLIVEPGLDGVIVRELATLEGQVLYDDRLYHHVVMADNEMARRFLVIFPILAVIGAVTGAVLWFRRPREVPQ